MAADGDDVGATLSDLFDQRVRLLEDALESASAKVHAEAVVSQERLGVAERMIKEGAEREEQLRQQVSRLAGLLESERQMSSYGQQKLQQMLAEERRLADKYRQQRDDALMQREDAVTELASVYADMDALQATLADSAVYVRYLRKKVLELEVEGSRLMRERSDVQAGSSEAFHADKVKGAIQAAVRDAYECDEAERRKRIKALQLRWHPDKNPVLTMLATEVTKIINEEITAAEARLVGPAS